MEQNQCAPLQRGHSDTPTLLLAGFPNEEAESITAAMGKVGWASTVLSNTAEIEAAFSTTRFDLTVIDAEHLEVYAPHFIARLRSMQGISSDAAILAVDDSFLVGFKEQLAQAGADLVVTKPSDPKMYISNFTDAATHRLQTSAKTRAEEGLS